MQIRIYNYLAWYEDPLPREGESGRVSNCIAIHAPDGSNCIAVHAPDGYATFGFFHVDMLQLYRISLSPKL